MKFSEIVKSIKSIIGPFLKDFGFNITSNDSTGIIIGYSNEDLKFRIGTDKLTRPEGYELPFGIEHIQFSKVEEILHPLMLKYNLNDPPLAPPELPMTFGSIRSTVNVTPEDKKIQAIHIDSEDDVEKYCEAVKELLLKHSFPWFEKYSKLEAVNELINSLTMHDILNCFSAPFPTQFYRAMVITSSCNNKQKTLEIKEECLRRFKECETDDFYTKETVQSYYNSLDDLCRQLSV